ncbi:phosphotransferase [Streptomyces sp. NPDC000594]|uniref:phosphotransferase n=1 Tax=Streptomyces sp. NPDC000594 TaxID=3154261 RepID=UPI00332F1AB4
MQQHTDRHLQGEGVRGRGAAPGHRPPPTSEAATADPPVPRPPVLPADPAAPRPPVMPGGPVAVTRAAPSRPAARPATPPGPGSEVWVREVLARYWGVAGPVVRPLLVDGAAPLSHTAGLWRTLEPGAGRVLKVRLTPEALRPPAFYEVKERIGDHCRSQGVPVGAAIPALDGRAGVHHDGTVSELAPWYDGAPADPADPAQSAAVVHCGLRLRRALDTVPGPLRAALATVPLPLLVEEEDWRAALVDAARLLARAERRGDRWSRLVADALRPAVAAGPLLHDQLGTPGRPPRPPAVIHSDLHPHHFILSPRAGDPAAGTAYAVRAVLDFDNLQVGDPLLDLAWLAEAAGRVTGSVARQRSLTAFLKDAVRLGLLRPGEETLLMPLLMAHSLPVITDIAEDILERGVIGPQWPGYFALLSPERRLGIHRRLALAGRSL